MKDKILQFLIIILCFLPGKRTCSQTDSLSRPKKILNFGAGINYFTDLNPNLKTGVTFATQLNVIHSRSLFSAGPLWWMARNYGTNLFKGGAFSYQYFPGTKDKFGGIKNRVIFNPVPVELSRDDQR